ncbi:hypothetical protein VA596_47405 [Amycolatopsis sp., V23-08]|uniref:Uncharacterized protein n=1 Tax=Amycolatopsis heterodermiae TaxID=3110235 RepID=A0ABU5RLS0_9PSEU|nr:hypothetical protein [Amycolatopsis sp., V23-08]MEA5367227.1 hypothetical protein [Amycolatopsis sp., V23-08]
MVAEWVAITIEATSDHLTFRWDGTDQFVIDDRARPDATDPPFADAEAVARGIGDDHTGANALTDVARRCATTPRR